MHISSGTDKPLRNELKKMAFWTSILSIIAIFIAISAVVIAIYSINSANQTAKDNQILFKQQLQVLEEIKDVLSKSKTSD